MKTYKEQLPIGKEVMVRATITEIYTGCHVEVQLANGVKTSVHLNNMLSPDLKPYVTWEDDEKGKKIVDTQ